MKSKRIAFYYYYHFSSFRISSKPKTMSWVGEQADSAKQCEV